MASNFDLSQLDKLANEGSTAKKGPKFQPKFLAKPRAGPSAPQVAPAKPASTAQPAPQPLAPAAKKQVVAPSSPVKAKPAAAVLPTKRQVEQPPQVVVEVPKVAASNRAPKRPRKQAQPLPAAAEFPGGLAIEPEATATAVGAKTKPQEPYEKLRPAASLSARAKARQDAALTPRKRGRPRKTPVAAPQLDGQGANEDLGATQAGPSGRARKAARTMSTSTTQPSRFKTEAERKKAGIRRPARSHRNYDKDLIVDDGLFTYEPISDSEATEDEENDQYFNYTGNYEAEEYDDDEGEAGPSTAGTKRKQRLGAGTRSGAGVASQQQRKTRKTPRKGDPLSTRGTKLKKIGDERTKRKVASLADQELDPDNWSMKKIVSWAGSRERKIKNQLRKEKLEEQKKVAARLAAEAAAAAAGGGGGGADGAGTSADAQQQHPNRGAGAGTAGAAGGSGSRAQQTLPSTAGGAPALPPASQQQQQQQQQPRNPNLAPQVQVVDGRIVVNRQSLTVQAQEREQYTRIVTEDVNRLNSMTYMNRISNERWTAEDTELFYKALSQFGTDFTLISHLFPGRERRHLKNKYTRENKQNPDRVDDAMRQSSNGAINSYNDMIVMLKESGMAVGAGAAAAAGVASPSAPAAAAVLNGIPSPSNRGGRGGGGNDIDRNGAAPLAITEAGEPASQGEEDETDESEQDAAPVGASAKRGSPIKGRKARA